MPVADYCTRSLVTVTPEETLRGVARKMDDRGVGCVVVVTRGLVTGMLTDRDVALRVLLDELDPDEAIVGQLMERMPVTVRSDAPLRVAAGLMRRHAVRRVAVVDESGHPEGLITADDLVPLLGRELAGLADAVASQAPGADAFTTGGGDLGPEVE